MLLLRPLKSKLGSRLRTYRSETSSLLRDILILVLLLVFSLLIFSVSWWTLFQLSGETKLLLPPELLLIFSFNIFLPMIYFTALSSALAHFFNSEDLELLLASPIKRFPFFVQRSCIVAIESSWMSVISILPFLLAFSGAFYTSSLYYLMLPIYLALFILIPSTFAILTSIIWGLIIPKIPPITIILGVIGGGIYMLFQLFSLLTFYLSDTSRIDGSILLTTLGKVESFGSGWSPGTWLAKGLSPFLQVSRANLITKYVDLRAEFFYSILAGFSCFGCFLCLGFLVFTISYPKALSNVWGKGQKVLGGRSFGKADDDVSLIPVPSKLQIPLALLKKESVDFLRDSSQIVQALFLISVIGIYLYVLRFQQNLLPLFKDLHPVAWDNILILINLTLECFITVAMATRLVFPSLSREGRGIWILQTSPVPLSSSIFIKYLFWSLPIGIVLSILSYVAFYLQYGIISVALVKVMITISSVACITALGMMLGAKFSNFLWESRSQLIASFGSLIYMVSALSLLLITMLATAPILLTMTRLNSTLASPYLGYLLAGCLCLFNLILARIFIVRADKYLTRKLLLEQ